VKAKTTIIGIGNANCGDDAAGCFVAQALRERELPAVRILSASGEPADLLEKFPADGVLILVDAMAEVEGCGRIHRMDTSNDALPIEAFSSYSTHGMGLPEAIEMARALGRLPPAVIVYGVEGRNFQPGDPLSPEVEEGIERLVEQLVEAL
jgi:hydrogenase maturation protease